ncbi:MAG: SMC family ATPase [Cyanobacteria bacterium J06623_5]
MIPQQLTLRNFLSYRAVSLSFDGLHVACVCGPNGAGKSSLLEAIAWCVWGQSRVSAEDDIVRQGATEAQVSFCFIHNNQRYRIIRTRHRHQTTTLEFQIQHEVLAAAPASDVADTHPSQAPAIEPTFKSITQKGVRATQKYILQQLKIDYETFVNSAYLRQGRADEFMLKRPGERKQVLADLLKLDRYDHLAEQAKEQARTYKAQLNPTEALLDQLSAKIEARSVIQQRYEQLRAEIESHQITQQQQQLHLSALRTRQQQRHSLQQQIALGQQEQQHQQATLIAQQKALSSAEQQNQQIAEILAQAEEIEQQHAHLLALRDREEKQIEQFQAYQQAQTEYLQCQQQVHQQVRQKQTQLAQLAAQRALLIEQEQKIHTALEKKTEIADKLSTLRTAKKQLRQLDKTEAQSAPLRQRFRHIQGQIEQAHTRLTTRLEELDSRQSQIATQQAQAPKIRQSAVEISHRLAYLEQRRDYQEAVRQKGIERRTFMERLRANQFNCEIELSKFDQTLKLLEDPDEAHCPLCEQALAGKPWEEIRDRTREQRNDVQNQIWAIREQLAVSESEIQVLRQEYRALEEELAKYAPFLEERGQLKAQLASVETLEVRLQAMTTERTQLARCLQENSYAEELQSELKRVEVQLAAMAYDDRNHALVRSQVERLRWCEIKQAEIKQAERRLGEIEKQRPVLETNIQALKTDIAEAKNTPKAQRLVELEQHIKTIDYSLSDHNALREQLKQADIWQARYHALQQAKCQQGDLLETVSQLTATCQSQAARVAETAQQVATWQTQLSEWPDPESEILAVEASIAEFVEGRERQLSQLGRLQQQCSQMATVEAQQTEQQQHLSDLRHKYQVYKSLAEAFGRNGIQALMIENLLPQLEAKTNQILGRLSNHQLHVQFVTQRTGQNRKKLIDTLDILIADARGTRPYETYSGGEAFRVNFSIRLAIAQLLALRSGTALQMLIVDEGFGTQDREGCDRLIAAIEAIAPDFACILTITHMPHFREAFQTRIDVSKDENGSYIQISS